MRGRAEPIETDALARLHARDAQRAKADDARTQKRCRVEIVEPVVERVHEVAARDHGRRVAAVDVVARERRCVAEILATLATEPAGAVRAAEPRDADARTDRDVALARRLDHRADDLMARHDLRVPRREFAFDDVQIGAAHAAGMHLDAHLTGRERGHLASLDHEAIHTDRSRPAQDGGGCLARRRHSRANSEMWARLPRGTASVHARRRSPCLTPSAKWRASI